MNWNRIRGGGAGLACAALMMAGCSTHKPPEQPPAVIVTPVAAAPSAAGEWAQAMAGAILAHPFPPAGEAQPLVVEMGIDNHTTVDANTAALATALTERLANSGHVRFVEVAQRNAALQAQQLRLSDCPLEAKVKLGRQLGARYMLTGTLIPLTREPDADGSLRCRLTMEVTELGSMLVILRKPSEYVWKAGS